MNIKIIIILLIILALINNSEAFGNYRTSCKSNYLPKLLKKVLIERGMKLNIKDWDITYHVDTILVKNKLEDYMVKKIFMIDGCDTIASKNAIFRTLKKYGTKASLIMPETFNLRSRYGVKKFIEHFKNKKQIVVESQNLF